MREVHEMRTREELLQKAAVIVDRDGLNMADIPLGQRDLEHWVHEKEKKYEGNCSLSGDAPSIPLHPDCCQWWGCETPAPTGRLCPEHTHLIRNAATVCSCVPGITFSMLRRDGIEKLVNYIRNGDGAVKREVPGKIRKNLIMQFMKVPEARWPAFIQYLHRQPVEDLSKRYPRDFTEGFLHPVPPVPDLFTDLPPPPAFPAQVEPESKVQYLCRECGSSLIDAVFCWDFEEQAWISTDRYSCARCDSNAIARCEL